MRHEPGQIIRRHRLPVRIMHWLNLACMVALFMSGLQIFNAHPALYWGEASDFASPALALTAKPGANGALRGETRIGDLRFDTTGVLGVSDNPRGEPSRRGFPMWSTIPGPKNLAEGRRWHFFFAWLLVINGLAYLLWSWRARHLRDDLAPTASDLRGFGRSLREHLRFRHPVGEQARRYNVLQKLAYLGVIVLLGPGIVLLGLMMAPQLDWLLGPAIELVGGRQSARTWHFIFAFALLGFTILHVFMVLVSGPLNQLRSMITGRYRLPAEPAREQPGTSATPGEGEQHVGK